MVNLKNNLGITSKSDDSFKNFKRSIKEYDIFKTRDNKEAMYIDSKGFLGEKIIIWEN
ncbi:MAG: hypothetical protein WBG30_08885 [Psychrilyobacter sp.]|uniref:hypothetical protein n=1 Tax=Psychrilyobacter sp. TaxID=2586924 RepID=UPI003C729B7B